MVCYDHYKSITLIFSSTLGNVLYVLLFCFRSNSDLVSSLETGYYKDTKLQGTNPKMLYKEGIIDSVTSCIETRYTDLRENPVVRSTRVASLKHWPTERNNGKHWYKSLLNTVMKFHLNN